MPSPSDVPSAPVSQPGRIDFLEGLRGVAVLLVILLHLQVPGLGGGGWVGVNSFFVISGFIITLLLLKEHQRKGRIVFGQFFLRRFLRLIPALVAMLVVMALAVRFFNTRDCFKIFLREGWWALGQGINWAQVYDLVLPAYLAHCWSLAVEWQFYLAWPFVLALLLRLGGVRAALIGTAVLTTLSLGWAAWLADHGASFNRIFSATDARISSILAGCLVALWWQPRQALPGTTHPWRWELLAWLCLGALAYETAAWVPAPFSHHVLFHHPLATAAAALLVVAILRHPRSTAGTLLGNPLLVWCGTISYGLYLWHFPIFGVITIALGTNGQQTHFWWALLLGAPLSFIAAWLSWRLIEAPCQALRHRFS